MLDAAVCTSPAREDGMYSGSRYLIEYDRCETRNALRTTAYRSTSAPARSSSSTSSSRVECSAAKRFRAEVSYGA